MGNAGDQSGGVAQIKPVLARVREGLKAELGEDAYHAAWERGEQLDLETVVQELLNENR